MIVNTSVNAEPFLSFQHGSNGAELRASGSWTVDHIDRLQMLSEAASKDLGSEEVVAGDLKGVAALDTFGALLLLRLLPSGGRDIDLQSTLPVHLRPLFDEVLASFRIPPPAKPAATNVLSDYAVAIGRGVSDLGRDLRALAEMLGTLVVALVTTLIRPGRFRLTSAVHHLDRVGWQAVPIILLITFLIGGIIAQQGIFHFRKFGADAYVVDMVGILVLREIGVLIVAIMVAGRSGSAYTAELGSMKMREEIDALQTMGLDPIEVLVLPRVIALVIALPILTFLGSMSALYGAELVAWLYGGMSPEIFVARLREAISVTHFKVGMIKAPFMALVIGLVACTQGLQVKGSAESLGLQTTASVVKSIFLVIVLDGLFAVFFASIDM